MNLAQQLIGKLAADPRMKDALEELAEQLSDFGGYVEVAFISKAHIPSGTFPVRMSIALGEKNDREGD